MTCAADTAFRLADTAYRAFMSGNYDQSDQGQLIAAHAMLVQIYRTLHASAVESTAAVEAAAARAIERLEQAGSDAIPFLMLAVSELEQLAASVAP